MTFQVSQCQEWQCRYVFPDQKCCGLRIGHDGAHVPADGGNQQERGLREDPVAVSVEGVPHATHSSLPPSALVGEGRALIAQWRANSAYKGIWNHVGCQVFISCADQLEALLTVSGVREQGLEVENCWRCFHCDEVFTTPGAARDHFGATQGSEAGCLIDRVALEEGGKPERGRGLLMALRKAEDRSAELVHDVESAENDARLWHESEGERRRLQKGRDTSWFMFLDSLEGERLVLAERVQELERLTVSGVPPWHPIETAPKDGTHVRLKRVYEGEVIADGLGYFGDVTIFYGGGPFVSVQGLDYAEPSEQAFQGVWIDGDGRHLFPTPTHWMPAPPAGSGVAHQEKEIEK